MIYFTQLIYVREGQEDTFHRFEELVLPLLAKYNGKLLLRIRPSGDQVIENNIGVPYEIHLVSFLSDEDFENFKTDKTRSEFLHLKEQSITSAWLLKGRELS